MKKILISLISILAIFFYLFSFVSIINAKQLIFSDDFEDGEFYDWTVLRNVGPNRWGVCLDTASPADWFIEEGRLGTVVDGTSCVMEIVPDNLNLTDLENLEFEFDWSLDKSAQMDRGVVFLWQDENNWYNIYLFGNEILLQKEINGHAHQIVNGRKYYSFVANQTYHFNIIVTADHRIKVFIDDQLILEARDETPFLTGYKTFGLRGISDLEKRSESFFDNIFIYSLDLDDLENILDVTLFKQNDPLWGGEIYDTAEEWSKRPTLARWGCALSSMAMILDFHNIKNLPGEIPVTPSSLNNWLKQQPDGYVGEGLLNWLAVTRLTRLISDKNGTPKLEYSRQNGDSLTPTIEAVDKNQPTILQIDGHFLVGAGYDSQKSDLIIKDPAYNYSLWSQHQTELIATRLFKPSFTDLSYILILNEPGLEINIKNSTSSAIPNLETFGEQIIADDLDASEPTPEKTKKYQVHQISKPASAVYELEIISPNYQEFNLEIYTYAENGEVVKFEPTGYAGPTPTIFKLDYKKEINSTNPENPNSTLSQIANWEIIINDLENLYANNLIKKTSVYEKLKQIATWGKQTPLSENKKRYVSLFASHLISYSDLDLNPNSKIFLNKKLNFLKESKLSAK
jgi:hypothetical protein